MDNFFIQQIFYILISKNRFPAISHKTCDHTYSMCFVVNARKMAEMFGVYVLKIVFLTFLQVRFALPSGAQSIVW